MGDTLARKMILSMAGAGVLCLSFWITLILIDSGAQYRPGDVNLANVPLTNEDGSRRDTLSSKLSDLPHPPIVPTLSIGWDGIEGLNALIMGPGPTGGGNLALSLIATRDNGRHRLGITFAGLPAKQTVHAIIWLKALSGTRVIVEVRDGIEPGRGPSNIGMAMLDLSGLKVLALNGNIHTEIGIGPSNWVKIPVDMPSSDGVFVIYLGLLGSGNAAVFRGGGEQMIFGGIEITKG
jgi:hypothetical protein